MFTYSYIILIILILHNDSRTHMHACTHLRALRYLIQRNDDIFGQLMINEQQLFNVSNY